MADSDWKSRATAFDADWKSRAEPVQSEPMSAGKAALIKAEEGSQLGLRPVVAGVGSALGTLLAGSPESVAMNPKTGQPLESNQPGMLSKAGSAFVQGRKEANQEQEQASKDHPYISGAANLAGNVATLPFLPAKGLAGAAKLGAGLGAAQAAGSANSLGEAATDVVGGGAMGAAGYGVGKAIGKGMSTVADSEIGGKIADKARGVLAKTASAFTGVPDKEIETYATQYDKVKSLLEEAGGNIPVAAEIQKENLQAAVRATKNNLNTQISTALQNASPEKNIDIAPVIQKLDEYKARLNPALHPESIADVDKLIGRISNAAPGGKASVQDLQQIKQFLGDQAANSFEGSALGFQVGREGSNAAKQGFLQAKTLMDNVGPEEIKNANRQLFQLHKIEDRINKNLISPGKSDAALMAVGSGAQNRDSLALQRLGQLSGHDVVGDAGVLSAANRFNNPSFSPAYGTGKSLLPVMGATAVGAGIGGAVDGGHGAAIGAGIGAGIGGAIASPAALKLAIDTGRVSGRAIGAVADAFGINPHNMQGLAEILQRPQAQEILLRSMSEDDAAASQPRFSRTIMTKSQLDKAK